MTARLDHANLVVRDLEGTLRFLQAAFPDFHVRGQGPDSSGSRWLHFGNDVCYLALHQARREAAEPWVPYSGKPGLNHLGFEVHDVEALRSRLREAGYVDSTVPNAHPHRKRVYFHDAEGNDWEFVQYLSDDSAERNDYEIEDLR